MSMDSDDSGPNLDGPARLQLFMSGQPVRPMALSLSDENCLAILLAESVHVVWLGGSPSNTSSLISCSRETIALPPATNYGVAKKVLDNFYDNSNSIYLEPTLSGRGQNTGYLTAAWSPLGCAQGNGCLLATCTRDHRVSLFAHVSSMAPPSWKEVAVVSDLHYERLQEGEINASNVLSFKGYKTNAYKTAAISLSWSQAVGPGNQSQGTVYLAIGYKSGNVEVWALHPPVPSYLQRDEISKHIEHVRTVEVGKNWVTALQFSPFTKSDDGTQSCQLFSGLADGAVVMHLFEVAGSESGRPTKKRKTEPKLAQAVPGLHLIGGGEDVLPSNGRAVDGLRVRRLQDGVTAVVAMRGGELLLKAIGSPSVISVRNVHKFSITDVVFFSDDVLVTCGADGVIKVFRWLNRAHLVEENHQSREVTQKPRLDRHPCPRPLHGLAVSQNNTFIATVQSAPTDEDRMADKMFQSHGSTFFTITSAIPYADVESRLMEILNMTDTTVTLQRLWDMIEATRLHSREGQSDHLERIIKVTEERWDDLRSSGERLGVSHLTCLKLQTAACTMYLKHLEKRTKVEPPSEVISVATTEDEREGGKDVINPTNGNSENLDGEVMTVAIKTEGEVEKGVKPPLPGVMDPEISRTNQTIQRNRAVVTLVTFQEQLESWLEYTKHPQAKRDVKERASILLLSDWLARHHNTADGLQNGLLDTALAAYRKVTEVFDFDTSSEQEYVKVQLESSGEASQPPVEPRDVCPFCRMGVVLTNTESEVCINNHMWKRCSRTLLLAATASVRTCTSCGRKCLPSSARQLKLHDSDWLDVTLGTLAVCPACDGRLDQAFP